MGNMATRYPELFGAAGCGVPLLDMRRYTVLSAGHSWIAEYGDPDDPARSSSSARSPPTTCWRGRGGHRLPGLLVWTATSDDRVGPVQARKMAARMLALGRAERLVPRGPRRRPRRSLGQPAGRGPAGARSWSSLGKSRGARRDTQPDGSILNSGRDESGYAMCQGLPSLDRWRQWRRARAAEWTSLLMKGPAKVGPGVQIPPSPQWESPEPDRFRAFLVLRSCAGVTGQRRRALPQGVSRPGPVPAAGCAGTAGPPPG